MGKSKVNKPSKNNPDLKIKKKENKILSVVDCEKSCKDKCDAYFRYIDLLSKGKILKGLVCKK